MSRVSSKHAGRVARDFAQRIVSELDGRGAIPELTVQQEERVVEAIEHDLRESLENLRIEEGGGDGA